MLRAFRRVRPVQPRDRANRKPVSRGFYAGQHRHVRKLAAAGENLLKPADLDLAFYSIAGIGRLFRKRKLSSVELTRLMLDRIGELNPKLNAYLTICGEMAIAQAREAERELCGKSHGTTRRHRGPLHGIPISLKDNICTA